MSNSTTHCLMAECLVWTLAGLYWFGKVRIHHMYHVAMTVT